MTPDEGQTLAETVELNTSVVTVLLEDLLDLLQRYGHFRHHACLLQTGHRRTSSGKSITEIS